MASHASNSIAPSQVRYLRACMVCSYVQTYSRFLAVGCPNCEAFLEMANHSDTIGDCTSQVFEGLITITNPADSWVARWNRLEGYVGGVYACKVVGMLPEDWLQTIEDAGVRYFPRDGTAEDEDA